MGVRRGVRGFSLLDILVTVAILAVLIAILIPSYGRARESAQRAVCLANVRQLSISLREFANEHNGRPFTFQASSNTYWAPSLMAYSSAVDSSKNLLKNTLCPCAVTPARNGVGTALLTWGPNSTPIDGLTIPSSSGGQTGSYGYNGWVYSNSSDSTTPGNNNQAAGYGVVCKTLANWGTISIKGSLLAVDGGQLQGDPDVTGTVTWVTAAPVLGGNAVIGGSKQDPTAQMPDVEAIYWNLYNDPSKVTINGANISKLDFTKSAVLAVDGNANFKNNGATVTGSGTLIVSGNVSDLPTSKEPLTFNIVCLGAINGSSQTNISGGIYCKGDFNWSGGGTITGIVVTNGTFNESGNGISIIAAPPPSFDNITTKGGYTKSVNVQDVNNSEVPIFADAIWAQGWPAVGDWSQIQSRKVNPLVGDLSIQLGRFYVNRHSNKTNVAFLDGSARSVPLYELPNLKWSNAFK